MDIDMKKRKKELIDAEDDHISRKEKKAAKKAAKVAKILGYSNETNPFGDSNLLQPFVWGKREQKYQNEGKQDQSNSTNHQMKTIAEIEKVRKRRLDRENELDEIERLRNEEQRVRESATYGNWEEKEEEFHLLQAKERSKIRLLEGREKPIDQIAKNILLDESMKEYTRKRVESTLSNLLIHLSSELRNPLDVIDALNTDELDQLISDLDSYLQLDEKNGGNFTQHWKDLITIASEMRRRQSVTEAALIHQSVQHDVDNYLRGKSEDELKRLGADIECNIAGNNLSNAEYWSKMFQEIKLKLLRSGVAKFYADSLQRQSNILTELRRSNLIPATSPHRSDAPKVVEDTELKSNLGDGTAEDEMVADDEVQLASKSYAWQEQFRPRKPRYLNRVKTGWDWNKYNQTHYDSDNPPPKVIQGYKFTLFYPDLIDKTKTPRYFIEPTDSDDFVIIRFSTGPPYEDVAFKIVNREWDVHRRSGFRSVFERGVLQLHFNFMRSFYRR